MKILSGHVSPETAYVIEDYPYGFRLHCKIRYWLEYKPFKGVRFCSQTTNPKKVGEVWNKPKYSTYSKISACMYLNEENYVTWSALTEYHDYIKSKEWEKIYRSGVPFEALPDLDYRLETVEIYECLKSKGIDYRKAAQIALLKSNGISIKKDNNE